jgi:hypothetical protein
VRTSWLQYCTWSARLLPRNTTPQSHYPWTLEPIETAARARQASIAAPQRLSCGMKCIISCRSNSTESTNRVSTQLLTYCTVHISRTCGISPARARIDCQTLWGGGREYSMKAHRGPCGMLNCKQYPLKHTDSATVVSPSQQSIYEARFAHCSSNPIASLMSLILEDYLPTRPDTRLFDT